MLTINEVGAFENEMWKITEFQTYGGDVNLRFENYAYHTFVQVQCEEISRNRVFLHCLAHNFEDENDAISFVRDFKEQWSELPAYRLRIATGELELVIITEHTTFRSKG